MEIRLLTFVRMSLLMALCVLGFVHECSAAPPNIIVFLVDDYDKPETSVYGGKVLTPNLDRLAREGVKFTNAYVTSTVCTPSRYTFLTGRYAGSSHCKEYLDLFPPGTQALPAFNVELEDDNMNVGSVLAKHGYATGYVGKYHVGNHFKDTAHRKRHKIHALPKNATYTDELNRKKHENEKRFRELIKQRGFTWAKNIYWGNLKAPFGFHNPEWTIDAALEFVEKHKDQPFYLHYATTLLHGPNGSWRKSLDFPGVTGEGKIDRDLKATPPRETVMRRIEKAGLTSDEAGYLWMDDSLGVLLDKLDELKIADNTIVLFVADHGSANKGSLQRHRGAEVPCVIRWPAGVKGGVVCDELLQNTDFVPTWFELAGVTPPAEYKLDGVSIAPMLKNPKAAVRDHVYCELGPARAIYTKQHGYIALRYTKEQIEAVRSGHQRTMKSMLGLSGGVSRSLSQHPDALSCDQLYDITSDPTAQKNLVGKRRKGDVLAEMRKTLGEELKRFPNRPFGEFVPGGNAVPGNGYDDVFETLREAAIELKSAKKKRKRAKPKK